jgi:hypothetical protein
VPGWKEKEGDEKDIKLIRSFGFEDIALPDDSFLSSLYVQFALIEILSAERKAPLAF